MFRLEWTTYDNRQGHTEWIESRERVAKAREFCQNSCLGTKTRTVFSIGRKRED